MKNTLITIGNQINLHSRILGLLMFCVLVLLFSFSQKSSSDTTHNLSGFAWSETIGWISMNCTDTSSCGTSPYGVTVAASGALSGYAWSEHIGWLSFNASDVTACPSGTCAPSLDTGTGLVTGWAKALSSSSTESGGWDGFVSLSGIGYGVAVDSCSWSGYAWGSTVVGWISFKGAGYGVLGSLDACAASATANLVSQNLTIPAGPYAEGVPFALEAQVRNNGGTSTPTGFYDDFSYQWDGTGGAWLPVSGGSLSKMILGGGSLSNDGPIPFTPSRTGTLYIQHCVDSNNEIDETPNETPNCTQSSALIVGIFPTGDISVNSPVDYGALATLVWSTSDTDSCTVEVLGSNGDVWSNMPNNSSGVSTTPLTSNTTYTLSCGGRNIDFATVLVNTTPTILASPRIILAGTDATLSWNTYGQSCTLLGGTLNLPIVGSGTTQTTVIARTTYTIDCPAGTASTTVEISPRAFET